MMPCSTRGDAEMHQHWICEKSGKIRHVHDPRFENQVLDITCQFLSFLRYDTMMTI